MNKKFFLLVPITLYWNSLLHFAVTEYVECGELFSLIDEYGCLPENVVRIHVAEIALAIGN